MGSSQHRGTSVRVVTEVLIATDADAVHDEAEAALADESTTVRRVRAGTAVGPAVAASTPDLVILDLQIGNMGGVASCVHLRQAAGAGRLPEVPIRMRPARTPTLSSAKRRL